MKIIFAFCGAIFFCAPFVQAATVASNNVARSPNQAPAAKSDKKSHGMPFHGNVAAIDKAAKSITMEGKMHRVFQVTAETKINRNKQPVNLDALAVGDYVGGYARQAPDGKLELVTLNITPQSATSKNNAAKGSGAAKSAK